MKQLFVERLDRASGRLTARDCPPFRYRLHDTSGRLLCDLRSDGALRPGMTVVLQDRTDARLCEVAGVLGIAATVRPVGSSP